MCGINLIAGDKQDPSLIESMNQKLTHRGPDSGGVYQFSDVSLGSRRLKIIDLDAGDMPLHSKDGRYHFIFNGEVYNYKNLREQVSEYPFESQSDSEVCFALIQKFGTDAISKFNGMFSFVFYDQQEQSLLIARDRLGIKPLFYAQWNDKLVVSSEINAILEHADLNRELDRQAMHHYLSLLSVPEPHTIYKNIRRFPSAHYAIYKNKRLSFSRYWNISFNKTNKDPQTLEEEIRDLFSKSIKRRLVSDVPLGVLLSSGIDSSIVAHHMKDYSTGALKSFSLGFEGGEDETIAAEETAKLLGCEHQSFTLNAKDLLIEIPDIIRQFAEPFAGGLPLWFLCRQVKKYVTVALSGTGGDEIFGNYGRSQHLQRNLGLRSALASSLKIYSDDFVQKLFSAPMAETLKHGAPLGHLYHDKVYPLPEWKKRELLLNPLKRTDRHLDDLLWAIEADSLEDRVFYADMNSQLKDEFLYSNDILSMAHSLELRVPFLDHELVELLAQVPVKQRSQSNDPKVWMRKIFSKAIPKHIVNRPKTGFMIPYGQWLREDLKETAQNLISKKFLDDQGLFNHHQVENLWNSHQSGNDHTYQLWSILMFQMWFKQNLGEPIHV